MPPAPKRNYGIIIFDLNSTKKEMLLKLLLKFATYKLCIPNRDVYELILCNSKETKNAKNYPNIFTTDVYKIDPSDVLECVENAETEEGDWLDSLLLSIQDITGHAKEKGIITFQIIFLTTLERTSNTFNTAKIQKIIDGLNRLNIFLYIIGPDVECRQTIKNKDDIRKLMQSLNVDNTNRSLSAAKIIVQGANYGVMANTKYGFDLFMSYTFPRGTQPWKVPLSFGSEINFPIKTVKVCRKERLLKLVVKYAKKPYYVLAEDEAVKVNENELIRGVLRHGKFVKIDSNDMFKDETVRGNDVLGFTSKDNIPEIYFRDTGVYHVLPLPDSGSSQCQAFYYLIDILSEQNKYAILRRVYNKGNKPQHYALIPRADLKPKHFIMSPLPHADELKGDFKYEPPKPMDIEVDDDVDKYLSSLDITNENCQVNVPMIPSMTIDPLSHRLTNAAVNKLLRKDYVFEDIDIDLLGDGQPNNFAERLKQVWDITNAN